MALYSNAMRLDPTNYALAVDVAESYYGIKPWRFEAALQSWTNAMKLAQNDVERQSVYIHLARVKIQAGRYDEARAHLREVTDESHAQLKNRLMKNADEREKEALGKK
jgi:predicted negative regulator of RcsB-dependent stress response